MSSPSISIPSPPFGWANVALLFAALCTTATIGTVRLVSGAIEDLGAGSGAWQLIFVPVIVLSALLFKPAIQAWRLARDAAIARAAGVRERDG